MNDNHDFLPLQCGVQHYAWGCCQTGGEIPYIPQLLGLEAGTTPWAELWVGAHPTLSANCDGQPLCQLIAAAPDAMLGKHAQQLYPGLPYLLKILSCSRPLSIQIHPDKQTAARLHQESPELYKDDNHKPEIMIALTPFELLGEFQPWSQVKSSLSRRQALTQWLANSTDLKSATLWLSKLDKTQGQALCASLAAELEKAQDLSSSDSIFLRLLNFYPGDAGALFAYLLNYRVLQPGEYLYIGAGRLHAYLSGTGIECMANSDNVIRAGLTGKTIDWPRLLQTAIFQASEPDIRPGDKMPSGATRFSCPAPEFTVEFWRSGQTIKLADYPDTPAELLILSGTASLNSGNREKLATKGTTWFRPAALQDGTISFLGDDTQAVWVYTPVANNVNDNTTTSSINAKRKNTMESNDFDFASIFEGRQAINNNIRTGEKVTGKVIMIDDTSVFVDLNSRSDGIIDKLDFADGKGGFNVKVGDIVTAYNMGLSSEGFKLQVRISGTEQVDSAVSDAFAAHIPIEGKVTGERKGGFTVQVGSSQGFCPFSQIDARGVKKEPAEYIGEKFHFLITELSEGGNNVVLSRRQVLESEAKANKARLRANLQDGDILEGTVTRIQPFGAFVDLGGVEGMVHVSEISWERGVKVEDCLTVGQTVRVKVLSVTWSEDDDQRDRISLSIKQAAENPWETLVDSPAYAVGTKRHGKVSRLADFGAFVTLEPGVDGLVHISQMGADHRIDSPAEVVSIGQDVDVTILGVDLERKRISLCIGEPKTKDEKPAELTMEEEQKVIAQAVAGQTVTGEIDSIKEFGVFVKLPSGQTGLLHISQILNQDGSPIQTRSMYRKYTLHSPIEVIVKEINGDRISLTLPETLERDQQAEHAGSFDVKDNAGASFGSLDDVFGKLKF